MKIGVLSDIHGNLQALLAIVNELKLQGINKYIIAGDLVSDCGQPNEVIDYVKQLNASVIKGNREDYVESYLSGNNQTWDLYDQMASVVWTAKTLTAENRLYLKNLPATQKLAFDELGVVTVVHGSPFKSSQLVFEEDETLLEACVNEVQSDVLITAHTHLPFSKVVNKTLVINPGAAGVHFNSHCGAEYAILEYCNDEWTASHHVAKYDLNMVKDKMMESGLYDAAPLWCELIHASLVDGFNHSVTLLNRLKHEYNEDGFVPNASLATSVESWLKQRG